MHTSVAQTKREVLQLISQTRSPERKDRILETIQAFAATDCRVDWSVIHHELTRADPSDFSADETPFGESEPAYEVEELELADLNELGFDLGD